MNNGRIKSIKHFSKEMISLVWVILFFIACNPFADSDPEPVLPHATPAGANTLGFLLDGKLWLPAVPFPDLTGSIYLACRISRSTKLLVLHTTRYISIRDLIYPARDSVRQVFITSVDNIRCVNLYKFRKWVNVFSDFTGKCGFIDFDYDMDTLTPHEFKVS